MLVESLPVDHARTLNWAMGILRGRRDELTEHDLDGVLVADLHESRVTVSSFWSS